MKIVGHRYLSPYSTVGAMGGGRTNDYVCGLCAVTSTDGVTTDWHPFLSRVATRIINAVTASTA